MYTPNTTSRRDYTNTRLEYKRFSSKQIMDDSKVMYMTSIPKSNYTISSIIVQGDTPSILYLLIDGNKYFSDVNWGNIISDKQITSIGYNNNIKYPLGISKNNPFPLYLFQFNMITNKPILVIMELNTIDETELNKLIHSNNMNKINYISYDIQLFKPGDVIKYKKCTIQRISFQTPSLTIEYGDIKSDYIGTDINILNDINNKEQFLITTVYLTNNISDATMGIIYNDEINKLLNVSTACYLWFSFDKISYDKEDNDES